jgi:hypothetical protein
MSSYFGWSGVISTSPCLFNITLLTRVQRFFGFADPSFLKAGSVTVGLVVIFKEDKNLPEEKNEDHTIDGGQ